MANSNSHRDFDARRAAADPSERAVFAYVKTQSGWNAVRDGFESVGPVEDADRRAVVADLGLMSGHPHADSIRARPDIMAVCRKQRVVMGLEVKRVHPVSGLASISRSSLLGALARCGIPVERGRVEREYGVEIDWDIYEYPGCYAVVYVFAVPGLPVIEWPVSTAPVAADNAVRTESDPLGRRVDSIVRPGSDGGSGKDWVLVKPAGPRLADVLADVAAHVPGVVPNVLRADAGRAEAECS
jgi:hypothetical protein